MRHPRVYESRLHTHIQLHRPSNPRTPLHSRTPLPPRYCTEGRGPVEENRSGYVTVVGCVVSLPFGTDMIMMISVRSREAVTYER